MTLREQLAARERQRRLQRFPERVERDLDAAALVVNSWLGGEAPKTFLFENLSESSHQVATNLWTSESDVAEALGVQRLDEIIARLDADLGAADPAAVESEIARRTKDWEGVRETAQPQSLQSVEDGLEMLPALRHWPGDGGFYLSAAVVITRPPAGRDVNVGLYRIMIRDRRTAAIRWSRNSDAARHARAWAEAGEKMPVGLILGAEPALLVAAATPLPGDISEIGWAGYLRQQSVSLIQGQWLDLDLPASAEWIIEGTVDPFEHCDEGPFRNFTGRYDRESHAPLFRLAGMRRQHAAIAPAIVTGPPPLGESGVLLRAGLRLMEPIWRSVVPEIAAVKLAPPAAVPVKATIVLAPGIKAAPHLRAAILCLPGLRRLTTEVIEQESLH